MLRPNEKFIIKSSRYSLLPLIIIVLVVSLIIGIAETIAAVNRESEYYDKIRDQDIERYLDEGHPKQCRHYTTISAYYRNQENFYQKHPSFNSWAECAGKNYNVPLSEAVLTPMFASLALNLFSLIIWLWLHSYSLTVTDKRVFGKAAFGRRVDLPVDSVSAIGTSWFKGIAIATASGKVGFLLIKNRNEIHEVMVDLLIERQDRRYKLEEKIINPNSSQENE